MITVIGMDGAPLDDGAAKAAASATLLVGSRRNLARMPGVGAATVTLGELGPALEALAGHDGDAVVLASGDPGFFGIVRALRARGLDPAAVAPARSSVSLAFARAGLPWDDALVASAHGRGLRQTVNLCRAHPKVAVLTGPGAGPAQLGAGLAGWERRMIVCERLGDGDERVTECSPSEAADRTWDDPNLTLVLAPGREVAAGPGWLWPPVGAPDGWALGGQEFGADGAVMTKPEVRALALARLAPRPGVLVWDVGAGAGTVAVECARFGAAVVAVERDRRRCELVRANARRHGVDVRVETGTAPPALAGLPDPDVVFVGGGGAEAAAAVAARRPRRIVAALAAVERIGPVHAALTAAGYDVDGVLTQASRLAPLPGGAHRFAPVNPVMLLWAVAR